MTANKWGTPTAQRTVLLSKVATTASAVMLILLLLGGLWHWRGYPVPSALAWREDVHGMVIDVRPTLLEQTAERLRIQKRERALMRDLLRKLENFSFSGRYLGCSDTMNGRWFLYFAPDGKLGLSGPSDTRLYHPDDGTPDPVDLSDVFVEPCRYRRSGDQEMIISGPNGERTFRLYPYFLRQGEPVLSETTFTFRDAVEPSVYFSIDLGRGDHYERAFHGFRKSKQSSKY